MQKFTKWIVHNRCGEGSIWCEIHGHCLGWYTVYKPQDSSGPSLLLESQCFLTLLACAVIKQKSVCWCISTVVKQSRTHLQRSEQRVINKEQFIHNLFSSWWTYQAQEGFQNRKPLWKTEAILGSVIYHCMLWKSSSMLTHLQSPILKAVEQFFPKNRRIRKYWSLVEFCLPLTHI